VQALAPRLPQQISQRKKMGFTFPMEHWLRNELAELTEQKIQFLAGRKEFNEAYLVRKWQKFQSGDKNVLWTRIWKLVVLADWLDRNKL
jgi:asparagine synthase (glutamine-hydrolysing)